MKTKKASLITGLIYIILHLQAQVIITPYVLPTQGNTMRGGNTVFTYTIGQATPMGLPLVSAVNNLVITPGFEQNIKPLPPIPPTAKTMCSDTAYTFNIYHVLAGKGADQIEWALNSNFDSSHIIFSWEHITVTVSPDSTDTVWIRSVAGGIKSVATNFTLHVTHLASPDLITPMITGDTVCMGGTATITLDSTQTGIRYDIRTGTTVIDSFYGNGSNLSFSTGALTSAAFFNIMAIDTSNGCQLRLHVPEIGVLPVSAGINYSIIGYHNAPDTVQFGAFSACATSWVWEFPGAASVSDSTVQNPVVVYDSIGNYTVNLWAGNGVDTPLESQLSLPIYATNFFATMDSQNVIMSIDSEQVVLMNINGGAPPYQITLTNSLDSQYTYTSYSLNPALLVWIDTSQDFIAATVVDNNGDTARATGHERFTKAKNSFSCGVNLVTNGNFNSGDAGGWHSDLINGQDDNEGSDEFAVYDPLRNLTPPDYSNSWFRFANLSQNGWGDQLNALCIDLPTPGNGRARLWYENNIPIQSCSQYEFQFIYGTLSEYLVGQNLNQDVGVSLWLAIFSSSTSTTPLAITSFPTAYYNAAAAGAGSGDVQWNLANWVFNSDNYHLNGNYTIAILGEAFNNTAGAGTQNGGDFPIDNIGFGRLNNYQCDVAANTYTICQGGSTTISAAAAGQTIPTDVTYEWIDETSFPFTIVSTLATPTVSPTVTTNYVANITSNGDGGSCGIAKATITVNVDQFTASASNNGPICVGQELVLFGNSGGTTYHWSGPSGFNPASTSDNNITVSTNATTAMSGTYDVTITDENGCSSTASTEATVSNSSSVCYCHGSSDAYTFNGTVTDAYVGSQIGEGGGEIIDPPPGTQIAFNGTLNVSGFMAFNYCDILFGPAAEIDVKPGAILMISASYLHACNTMWQGINVESGGYLLLMGAPGEGSEIEDALYAVQLNNGSYFESQYTNYANNFIGIYYNGLSGNFNQTFHNYMGASLIGNTFQGTRPLLPGFGGMSTGNNTAYHPSVDNSGNLPWAWAGIHAIKLQTLTVGANGSAENKFDSIANGIITDACNLTVSNSTFEATHAFGYYTAFQYGTNAYQYGLGSGILFQGNGILATNWNTPITTTYPHILVPHALTETGLGYVYQPFTFANCDQGIVTDRMNVNISENYMTNNYVPTTSAAITGQVGIKVGSDPRGVIQVNLNQINYISSGMQFLQNDPIGNLGVGQNIITVSGQSSLTAGLMVSENGNLPGGGMLLDQYHDNTIFESTNAFLGAWFNKSAGFYSNNNTVQMQDPTVNLIGMYHSNCSAFTDQSNHITGVLSGSSVPVNATSGALFPVGMYYASCTGGATYTNHECNYISKLYTGMYFFMPNGGSTFITGNQFNPSYVSGKNMNDGMLFDPSATSFPSQLNAGNEWFGITVSGVDQTYSNYRLNEPGNNLAYFTTYHGSGTPYLPINAELNPPGIVYNVAGPVTNDSTCSIPCAKCLAPAGLTAVDTAVINGTANFDSSAYPTQMLWLNQNQLYRKMLQYPNLIDSLTEADSFFVAVQHSPMGQLTSVDSIWYRGVTLDSAAAAGWLAKLNAIDSLTQLIPPIDSILADTASADSKDSTELEVYEQSIYSTITGIDTTADSAMINYYGKKDSAAAAALALNATISPGNTIESNAVLYNEIYYSTIAIDSSVFDSTRIAQLYYLASQCPITGGDAVYAARSLLAMAVDTFFNDLALCSTGGDRMLWISPSPGDTTVSDTLPKKLQVKMYPNPAQDYTLLQLNQNITPLQLQITDGVGQIIVNQPISTAGGNYTINTAGFASGLYYVSLYSNNGKIFGDKLSIFR